MGQTNCQALQPSTLKPKCPVAERFVCWIRITWASTWMSARLNWPHDQHTAVSFCMLHLPLHDPSAPWQPVVKNGLLETSVCVLTRELWICQRLARQVVPSFSGSKQTQLLVPDVLLLRRGLVRWMCFGERGFDKYAWLNENVVDEMKVIFSPRSAGQAAGLVRRKAFLNFTGTKLDCFVKLGRTGDAGHVYPRAHWSLISCLYFTWPNFDLEWDLQCAQLSDLCTRTSVAADSECQTKGNRLEGR